MEWIDSQLPAQHEPFPVNQVGHKPGYVPQTLRGDRSAGHWLSPAMAIWVKAEEPGVRIPVSIKDDPKRQR